MEGRFGRIGQRWRPAGDRRPSPDAPVFGSWRPVQGGDELAGELLRLEISYRFTGVARKISACQD